MGVLAPNFTFEDEIDFVVMLDGQSAKTVDFRGTVICKSVVDDILIIFSANIFSTSWRDHGLQSKDVYNK